MPAAREFGKADTPDEGAEEEIGKTCAPEMPAAKELGKADTPDAKAEEGIGKTWKSGISQKNDEDETYLGREDWRGQYPRKHERLHLQALGTVNSFVIGFCELSVVRVILQSMIFSKLLRMTNRDAIFRWPEMEIAEDGRWATLK